MFTVNIVILQFYQTARDEYTHYDGRLYYPPDVFMRSLLYSQNIKK